MSSPTIRFHDMAFTEFKKTHRRYLKIDPRLAADFQAATDEAVAKIAEGPESWPKSRHNTHWLKTRRFPYILYYRILDKVVLIVAVAHERRRPGYWVKRLPPSIP